MRWALLVLVAAAALAAPGTAFAQGGTSAPDFSDPCPATYPGDDAAKHRIARWMARGAGDRGLPGELPVMAGIGESGLRNLSGGSYAGFGMSLVLDEGEYTGFPRRPALQLEWFLDTAVLVRQRRLAGGLPDPAADPQDFGLWIADVERPAPENRSRYQQYLNDAQEMLGTVCPAPVVSDSAAPALVARVARRQRPLRAAGSVSARVRCPAEPCLAGLTGTVTVDGRTRSFGATPVEPQEGEAATLRARAVDAAANVAELTRRVRALP